MGFQDFIFKLTKTHKIYLFELVAGCPITFPKGWRKFKIDIPTAFYDEKNNAGITIYNYEINESTIETYTSLLTDEYSLELTDFLNLFKNEHSAVALNKKESDYFEYRILKLHKTKSLIDITIAGKKETPDNSSLFKEFESLVLNLK